MAIFIKLIYSLVYTGVDFLFTDDIPVDGVFNINPIIGAMCGQRGHT